MRQPWGEGVRPSRRAAALERAQPRGRRGVLPGRAGALARRGRPGAGRAHGAGGAQPGRLPGRAYALKHPEHVQHLVLVCPAGVVRA